MTTPPANVQPVHEHPAPPQEDQLVRDIALVLAGTASIAAATKGIQFLLKPYGIGQNAILAALGISNKGTAHRPNARLTIVGAAPGSPRARTTGVVRETRDNELYFRAAYVLQATRRIHASMKAGKTIPQAVAVEKRNTRAHEQARRNRLEVAAKMQQLASRFGPLLGWYRDPLSDSESECVQADGHNFNAIEGTIIGFPGSVHPHCRCVGGPPHENGGMVNDNVTVSLSPITKTFRLKK